jgi:hypothetical protein
MNSGFLVGDDRLGELAAVARAIFHQRLPRASLVDVLGRHAAPVCGELRKAGRLIGWGWECQSNQWMSLCRLLQAFRQAEGDELLLCVCKSPHSLGEAGAWRRALANIQRGLAAYELRLGPHVLRWSPFRVIAQNRPLEKTLTEFVAASGSQAAGPGALSGWQFETEQYWIDLSAPQPAVRLFRGSCLVPLHAITRGFVSGLGQLLSGYLVRSVQSDGRMVYLYYPSRGTEDLSRNNAIRQWMATRALLQVGRRSPGDLQPIVRRNIEYNLQTMYREEGGLGLIFDGEKVKLGAVALAALALAESPLADEYRAILQRLCATVSALWTESGQFRTFYRPAHRNDCQNFYPGEALLLWARLLATGSDTSLAARFWRSFEYYQRWHKAHRNPAFIPWHTQAYWNVWQLTRDRRLADAILDMNDWLLPVQQWESTPHPDCRGRFYDPHRPFGPPHASSTGVYLEGLADAWALARELGDAPRLANYRTAILRGLRSIAQLTFKDDLDMFYVTQRDRLRGGVRTTEYHNVVRIDNVQHGWMAIQKVLDVFTDADFAALS